MKFKSCLHTLIAALSLTAIVPYAQANSSYDACVAYTQNPALCQSEQEQLSENYCSSDVARLTRGSGCVLSTHKKAYNSYQSNNLTIKVYPAENHGTPKFRNTIILLPGWEMVEGETTLEGLESIYSSQISDVRKNGTDLILVNFRENHDLIQNNGLALYSLLEYLNSLNGVDLSSDGTKLSIIGASMGGLIARWGLLYMEHIGIDHNVNLYVTLDTPHRGSNIPLARQSEIVFGKTVFDHGVFAEPLGSLMGLIGANTSLPKSLEDTVNDAYNGLRSSSAKQMLISQYEHDYSLRNQLFNELQYFGGHPSIPKRVAVSAGGISGLSLAGQDFTGLVRNFRLDVNGVTVDIDSWYGRSDGKIFHGTYHTYDRFNIRREMEDKTTDWFPTHDADFSPGSHMYNSTDFNTNNPRLKNVTDVSRNGLISYTTDSNTEKNQEALFTFIPTVSSIDADFINYDVNLLGIYGDVESITNATPFDEIIFVSETPEYKCWHMGTGCSGNGTTSYRYQVVVPTNPYSYIPNQSITYATRTYKNDAPGEWDNTGNVGHTDLEYAMGHVLDSHNNSQDSYTPGNRAYVKPRFSD